MESSLLEVKKKLTKELYDMENDNDGSISLSAGSCNLCQKECAKTCNNECRHPEKLRYSIEALGGNVGLTISKLMKLELEWVEEGVLPGKFVLVCGLLMKEE